MKKLISILICTAMILSLIPAVAAAEDATLEYVFTNSAQGGSGTVTPVKTEFYGFAETGAEWQFINMVNYNACALYNEYSNWAFSTSGKPEYNGEDKMTGAYAIELKIPEPGTYTPTLNYRAVDTGATAEIYLVNKENFASGEYYFTSDITASKAGYDNAENASRREVFISAVKAMSTNDRIGMVNTYSAETAENQPETFRDIEIEKAGSYILVVVPNGAAVETENGVYHIQLHSFKLDKVVENTAVKQEFVITTAGETEDWEVVSSHIGAGSLSTGLEEKGFKQVYRTVWFQQTAEYRTAHVMLRINVKAAGTYTLQVKGEPADTQNDISGMGVFWLKDNGKEIEETAGETDTTTNSAFDLVGGKDRSTHSSLVGSCDFDDEKPGYQDIATVTIEETGNYLVAFFGTERPVKTAANADTYPVVYLSGIKLVPVDHVNVETNEAKAARESIQNEDGGNLSAEADKVPLTANINAFTMFGDEVMVKSVTAGEKVTVTAPDKTGYTFLYWAKGLSDKKVIVSDKNSYTFTAVRENNPLIAVYTSDTAETKVEFYNGNFQLLDAKLDADNKLPALPAEGIAGYGEATHWELFGDDKEYAPGDVISPSGNMIFVAQYEELEKNIKVTVNGEEETYAYGDLVTVTAPARSGSNVFNYWLRDNEIVGFGKTYSFYAYEDCVLTAVYKEYEPINKTLRKIILDTMDDGRLMAEFIGFGDAAEKGIMIGSKKIAMTTASSQFALWNDETGDVVGYAVDKDGNIYYGK